MEIKPERYKMKLAILIIAVLFLGSLTATADSALNTSTHDKTNTSGTALKTSEIEPIQLPGTEPCSSQSFCNISHPPVEVK